MRSKTGFTIVLGIALLAFGAPASATHVACGDTITTTTVLDSDIVCTATDATGLTVAGSGITLWFDGHTVTGSAANTTDVGITGNVSGLTIRGEGSILGFARGISLSGPDNSVRRMTVTTTECGDAAIRLGGDRAYAYRNVVELPPCIGPNSGIILTGTQGSTTSDVYAWGNTVRGGSGPILVTGNGARVVLNTIECSGPGKRWGVEASGYTDFTVVSINTVSECVFGIRAVSPGGGNGRFRRNVLTGNGSGIFISDPTSIVAQNAAEQNIDGIVVNFEGTIVRRNVANDNTRFGISAVTGVVDGGGNTATGNGTTNCVNVLCGP